MRTFLASSFLHGLAAAALLLGGCAPALAPTPTPSLPPVPPPTSPVSIPTVMPTPSLTPASTATSVTDVRSGAGELMFEARFAAGEGWVVGSDTGGGASLSGGSLVLAVSLPNASRFVMAPTPPQADFLLEAGLRASLCSAADEIGILFRVTPVGDHYRFTLDCQGEVRVTRVVGTGAVLLAGPTDAPSAIPGSPAENRLAVLGRGDTFSLLVNDEMVLEVRDPLLTSGQFGFFVRSASQGQTTAALTAFRLRALLPAATPSPSG